MIKIGHRRHDRGTPQPGKRGAQPEDLLPNDPEDPSHQVGPACPRRPVERLEQFSRELETVGRCDPTAGSRCCIRPVMESDVARSPRKRHSSNLMDNERRSSLLVPFKDHAGAVDAQLEQGRHASPGQDWPRPRGALRTALVRDIAGGYDHRRRARSRGPHTPNNAQIRPGVSARAMITKRFRGKARPRVSSISLLEGARPGHAETNEAAS
jgi:hypothetical protein